MKGINLLPKDVRPGTGGLIPVFLRKLFHQSPILRILFLLLLIGAGAAIWNNHELGRYRSEIARYQRELRQIKGMNSERKGQQQTFSIRRSELLVEREKLEARRQALAGARHPEASLCAILTEFVKLLPREIWMIKFSFTDGVFRIVGSSQDTASVVDLIAVLDRSGRFRQTTFDYSKRAGNGEDRPYTFEISTVPVMEEGTSS